MFFPSITDRNETINADRIIPIVGKIDNFNMFVSIYAEDYSFCPTHLVSHNSPPPISNNFNEARETMYNYLSYAICESNSNLHKNALDLLQSKGLTKNRVKWLVDISELKSTFRFTNENYKKWM